MAIHCDVDIPKVSGLNDGELTVGRDFFLICKGEWPKNLQQDKLQFAGDANIKYQIRLRSFEFRSPEEADLKVTSYLAQQHQVPNLVLTDGTQNVDLGQVQFAVKSVLPEKGAGAPAGAGPGAGTEAGTEKVEPYGPFGPATIPVPLLYWVILLGGIALVLFAIVLRVWRYNQRREMLLRLKEHDSSLSPLMEFHQNMRRLQRANPVFFGKEASAEELRSGVAELSKMFKVYSSRRLHVPAFEWNERLILSDLRRYHRSVYDSFSKRIGDLFREFKKAEAEGQKLQSKDVSQLSEGLRKTLEGIEELLGKEEAAKPRRSRD